MTNETRILAAVAGMLMVAAAFPASAQSVQLTADVPFEFGVAGETMPRDVYRISRPQEGSAALILRGERKAVIAMVRQGNPHDAADNPKLVFHRIGDQYFLREVQLLGRSALDLPETAAERAALERMANASPAGVQRVVVAAR